MKLYLFVLSQLISIATLFNGCQSTLDQSQPVEEAMPGNVANVCNLRAEGTTFKSLVESVRGKELNLVSVVRADQVYPPFAENQWVKVDLAGKVTGNDGCNLLNFEPITSPKKTSQNPFFQHFEPHSTLVFCPESPKFPLMSVYRYQQCDDAYWLYYNETATTQPHIMVFTHPR